MTKARCRALMGGWLLTVLASCGSTEVEVRPDQGGDYNRAELYDAISVFTAAGRTPQAYWRLAEQVRALRSGMDEQVAEEAEPRLS